MLAIANKPPPSMGAARDAARDQRDRQKAARARAMSLIPRDNAPLTRENIRDLKEVDRHVDAAAALDRRRRAAAVDPMVAPPTRDDRDAVLRGLREARRILLKIEADRGQRTHERYIARVTSEITRLETDRGEEVRIETVETAEFHGEGRKRVLEVKTVGRLRITTRDGLEVLAKKTPAQMKAGDIPISALAWAAGLRVRELYEMVDPERALRPPPLDPDMRGGGPSHGGEGWDEKRREVSDQLARVIWAVRTEGERAGGAETGALWVKVLTEVVCKGTPIKRAVLGRRAQIRWREVVDDVLDVVADRLGMH